MYYYCSSLQKYLILTAVKYRRFQRDVQKNFDCIRILALAVAQSVVANSFFSICYCSFFGGKSGAQLVENKWLINIHVYGN